MTNPSRSPPRKRANQLTSAAAAVYPPWVLLRRFPVPEVHGSSSSIADTKTLAAGHTSTNHPITVSLSVAPPPEASRVCVQLPDGVNASSSTVLAAHGDSVLIQVAGLRGLRHGMTDHFVYNAGDAAAAVTPRTPSLLLLPPITDEQSRSRSRSVGRYRLDGDCTGLLRRGDNAHDYELVVAELTMAYAKGEWRPPEFRVLRSGEKVEWPRIRRYSDGGGAPELASSWRNDMVVPVAVGDRQLLCWVDLGRGLLFSNVFDETPVLRHVPLPAGCRDYSGRRARADSRNVCVTSGSGALKLIDIIPCYDCGSGGDCGGGTGGLAHCTVHTWTLSMDGDMAWVKDGVLDGTQLWVLDGYKGLPRVKLEYPVVSLDDPHALCFVVCEVSGKYYREQAMWLIMVDMRSKTRQSVFRYIEGWWRCSGLYLGYSSRVSDYFNSKSSCLMPADHVIIE